MKNKKVLFLTQLGIFIGIEAIFCFTPLGSLPVGPIVATLAHIPVIITAIILGPLAGTILGFSCGMFSFIVWTFMPPNPMVAFLFTPAYPPGNFYSLIVCFLPRILLGTFAGVIFRNIMNGESVFASEKMVTMSDGTVTKKRKDLPAYLISSLVPTFIHTVLVLWFSYLFFAEAYAAAYGITKNALLMALLAVVGTNGILEMVLAGIVVYAVAKPINTYINKR